jgi:hypothetical protein
VRFARLIDWRGRVLGGPAVRAACGGHQSLPCVPRMVTGWTEAFATFQGIKVMS